MAEEIIVTYTPSDYKTWDETNIPWDDIHNAKPWEAFGNNGVLKIHVKESFEVSDNFSAHLNVLMREKFFINDFKFEPAHIVLNDLNFVEDVWDNNDLQNLSTDIAPLGYERSRPLFPGEYTYQDAIVGIQMKSNLTGNKIGVYQAKLNVDVEDVVDRGRVEVTSTDPLTPTRVTYNKKYYVAPEELMFNVLQTEEPSLVQVVEKTDEYFEIMLKGINSGNYVTGTVSWVSTGY